MPCSETERPRATASSRSCTLWALEPVKCCSRLPNAAGGTIRRSTATPFCVWARTAVAPRAAAGGVEVEALAVPRPAPGGAGDLDPVRRRVLAQRRRQLVGDRQDLGE